MKKQYTLVYTNRCGDTIARDYFEDLEEAKALMNNLIKIYKMYGNDNGLSIEDEEGNVIESHEYNSLSQKTKEEMKSEKNYAVIFTYSFDDDVAVYLFENEKEAKEFLKESYENELKVDKENGWDSRGFINSEETYANIEVLFEDHINTTEMRIGNIYQ